MFPKSENQCGASLVWCDGLVSAFNRCWVQDPSHATLAASGVGHAGVVY